MKPGTFSPALTRRRLLQGSATLAASAFLPGCGSSGTPATSAVNTNTNPQPVPATPITQVPITVAATAAGSIGPAFAGLSYEKDTLYTPIFSATNSDLILLFQLLGTSILRIGGNSVDKNVWTPNGKGQTAGQIAPSDVTACAAFAKATGWQVLYGVNLEGSSPSSPYTTTPTLAAEEVAFAVQAFGSSLYGIEIGNECDIYGNATDYYYGNWSLSKFETLWETYRTAILAQSPGVNITGPASAGSENSWTIPFGQYATKSQISLLTQHYYRANGQSPTSTDALLISPDSTLLTDLQELQTAAAGIGIPYRISECNSYYNGGAGGVSDSYASSLWIIDFLFNNAQYGSSGCNFHGGGNGTGYTPIADSNGVVQDARPEYYGIFFFTLAGQGTLYQTTASAGSLNFTAYTVKTASGGLNIILNNKDSAQNVQATIQLPQTAHTATLLELTQSSSGVTGPTLSATSGVTIQGATISVSGGYTPAPAYTLATGSAQITCYVPYLSAVLIQIT